MPLPGAKCSPQATVTATVSGNTGALSWSWTRVDGGGGTTFTVTNGNTASPTFSLPPSYGTYDQSQTWRGTATDAGTGQSVYADVVVELANEYIPAP